MALEEWYLHKAQQCSRLSAAETDPRKRAALQEDAELWRGFARDMRQQDPADADPLRYSRRPAAKAAPRAAMH
jgi:hypothetical protein